jgi:isoamylase
MTTAYYERIDSHPTHTYGEFRLRAGRPYPLGATIVPKKGVNFAVFSHHATSCTLVLFEKGASQPFVEIPFPDEFKVGTIFAMTVYGLDLEELNFEYGYRMDGRFEPHKGHWFDTNRILLDPYAKAISGRDTWKAPPDYESIYPHRARVIFDDYDWEDDRPLNIPIQDLIIYEMHVHGFTAHPSSNVRHPGTFSGIREKIPYLKALGINCVELMPIFEFDEWEYDRYNPLTGERLINYWGYSTIGFFAPKAGYAATGAFGMQVDELKTLIKELHRNGIEVILDVVFNHTAEGNEKGHTISFRGLDNKIYYMLAPDGSYLNFSGTGNTMNCNHPVVRNIVLECLRYWVAEYHIDGFRFDLASILGRDQRGMPLANPPLLEMLAGDPVLANVKLIAEAWDAGGLYQVGSFPAYGRWAEWNGKYRDTLRRFLRGDEGMTWEVAERIQGSPDLYHTRGTSASINFITCHDGFSLIDLFSYNNKHNEANGEDNRDGANDNYSWNCGVEGQTSRKDINHLRRKQVRNAAALMLVSQGVPMFLMGDELAHTKAGNNNTYCHDNELNWLNWEQFEENADIYEFFQRMIAFRNAHPVLRRRVHFSHRDIVQSGYPDISWHSTQAWQTNWLAGNRTLAFMLCGRHSWDDRQPDDYIYVAANMDRRAHRFELPMLPHGMYWNLFADTEHPYPHTICEPGSETPLIDGRSYKLAARAVVILVGKQ